MKIISNLFAFIISTILICAALYLVFPKWEAVQPMNPFVDKDVPLPTMLHPVVKDYQSELVDQAAKKGINVVITEGHRSAERQNALYEKGRSEEGRIVTYAKAGESYHNYGLAIDFALRNENGGVSWDMEADRNGNGRSDWMEVVAIAKQLGFEWGGDWSKFKDYPHLQMNFGLSIRQLKRGHRPKVESYAK
ncbi:M15 family metallopeptidase [Halobacillus yeomjeoni]|uniref:M15 family metallopeptidase n=1 Tax=Halobacillus yeomjeoni TaxID=311194 RepID=UPI00296A9FAF|nr:M15 family metallopeptidase [Halobacillus yeomjeoni]